MNDKPTSTHVLALTHCGKMIKTVVLRQHNKEILIEQLLAVHSEDVNPLYMDQISQIRDSAIRNLVVTGLETEEVLVRPLELKLTKAKDIDAVFAFQAEPLLPYTLDKGIVDKILTEKNDSGTSVSVIAVRKDYLHSHIEKWKALEIEPEIVSSIPVALATFTTCCQLPDEIQLVYHLGMNSSALVLVQHGKLLGSHAFPIGFQNFVDALAQDRNMTKEEAEKLLPDLDLSQLSLSDILLKDILQQVSQAFLKAYYFLTKTMKGKNNKKILVVGLGGSLKHFYSDLSRQVNSEAIVPTCLQWNLTTQQLQEFAIPIGLALTALPGYGEQVNFRQQEFAYPSPWKRLKKPLIIYGALCLLTALCLFLFGQAWLGYREDKLKEEYVKTLQVMNKPYGDFEAEFLKKNPQYKIGEQLIPLKSISQAGLLARIQQLEKELQSTPDIFPLQPNTPRVSDVLAWLNTHPNVLVKEGDKAVPQLQIENFVYSMVKRPELNKKQEKYQVKVELEFSAATPKQAREFHDALIAPNDFVDPKGEVKWSSNRGRYRTSFFLKDKTSYTTGTGN